MVKTPDSYRPNAECTSVLFATLNSTMVATKAVQGTRGQPGDAASMRCPCSPSMDSLPASAAMCTGRFLSTLGSHSGKGCGSVTILGVLGQGATGRPRNNPHHPNPTCRWSASNRDTMQCSLAFLFAEYGCAADSISGDPTQHLPRFGENTGGHAHALHFALSNRRQRSQHVCLHL